MTADVPAELAPKLRDCEIDLNAAFAQVRPAVQRREAITEAMRVHQRVLRPLRPALITSPEVKPHTSLSQSNRSQQCFPRQHLDAAARWSGVLMERKVPRTALQQRARKQVGLGSCGDHRPWEPAGLI